VTSLGCQQAPAQLRAMSDRTRPDDGGEILLCTPEKPGGILPKQLALP
jgi:hypothetical protein